MDTTLYETRYCEYCNAPIAFTTKSGRLRGRKEYANLHFCSLPCQAEGMAARVGSPNETVRFGDTKICEWCGKEFGRRLLGIKKPVLEFRSFFAARRFCSQTCHLAARRAGWMVPRKEAVLGPEDVGDFCEACGTEQRDLLLVHHIDQNHENNAPENRQTLCGRCHNFWHSIANHLGLPVAGRMPPLFESVRDKLIMGLDDVSTTPYDHGNPRALCPPQKT